MQYYIKKMKHEQKYFFTAKLLLNTMKMITQNTKIYTKYETLGSPNTLGDIVHWQFIKNNLSNTLLTSTNSKMHTHNLWKKFTLLNMGSPTIQPTEDMGRNI